MLYNKKMIFYFESFDRHWIIIHRFSSSAGDAGCLSAYLSFEHVTGKIIYDDSNNGNQATMIGTAKIIDKGKFGKALRLTKDGTVSFDVINFHNRPSLAITIALWLQLSEIKGVQEIFYTCGKTEKYNLGAYHISVDEGIVKWSQKNKDGDEIFSLASGKKLPCDQSLFKIYNTPPILGLQSFPRESKDKEMAAMLVP
jgi:hypothetical protein